jgi:pimeloyl-ACP methyl ester carboxylesterase
MLADGRLAGSPTEIDYSSIRVPTLIISAKDDLFGTAGTARQLSRIIPNSRLVLYETGGHVWVGREEAVSQEIARFSRSVERSN